MHFERRVVMFAVLSVVCFILVPIADEAYRVVPITLGIVYAVLALLFLLDWLSRWNEARKQPD